MGFFDGITKMFGFGASEAEKQPNAANQFATLRDKYKSAIELADQNGVELTSLQTDAQGRLQMWGIAPDQGAYDAVMQEVFRIEPGTGDIDVQLQVSQPISQQVAQQEQVQTYTVQSGDTLSKISRELYGDSDEYMRIFYANRDKLNDPDKIQVGQELVIPAQNQQNA